jgi:hypothetical protein
MSALNQVLVILLLLARTNLDLTCVHAPQAISEIPLKPVASLVVNVFPIWTVHLLPHAKKDAVLTRALAIVVEEPLVL